MNAPQPPDSGPRPGRLGQGRLGLRLAGEFVPAIRLGRLLLALKAALAAGVAWAVGTLIPGSIDEYSYYAPLGAIIAMTPSLMGSLRTSAQTAVSLALGVALAWGVLLLREPSFLSVPLAVGGGVLLAGIGGLGPGRNYVPIAALFVLVIGGGDAEDFSIGYVVQMAVGMVIGVAVNLIVVPPLYLSDAAGKISSLRRETEERLTAMAAAIRENRLDDEDWRPGLDALHHDVEAARQTLDEASDSRRGNPRSRWHRYDMQEDYDDLRALRRVGYHLLDIGDALTDEAGIAAELPGGVCAQLASALEATGGLVRAWDDRQDEPAHADAAKRELEALTAAFEDGRGSAARPSEALGTIVFDLRRMVTLLESRLRSTRQAR